MFGLEEHDSLLRSVLHGFAKKKTNKKKTETKLNQPLLLRRGPKKEGCSYSCNWQTKPSSKRIRIVVQLVRPSEAKQVLGNIEAPMRPNTLARCCPQALAALVFQRSMCWWQWYSTGSTTLRIDLASVFASMFIVRTPEKHAMLQYGNPPKRFSGGDKEDSILPQFSVYVYTGWF